MNLGERIYEYRTLKNLSQGDLAEKLEVSRQSVSKWENGAAVPDLDKIIRLAEVFGVTIDELVKGKDLPFKEEAKAEAAKEKSSFPPRKIAGTVLLSLSVLVTVILLGAGGGFSGLILSLPLVLCGIVCFVFKKNVGLWCAWTAFFAVDMYIRFAMGLNWNTVRNTFIWSYDMNYGRLAVAWVQFIVLVVMIIITVLRFRKIPLENKKLPVIFWAVFVLLRLAFFAFSKSEIYIFIMTNIISYSAAYTICYSVFDWICAGIFTAAVTLTTRYFFAKKHKTV